MHSGNVESYDFDTSDTSSAYDGDVQDELSQGLWTKGWTLFTDHHTNERDIMINKNILWVENTTLGLGGINPNPYHYRLRTRGNELAGAEFMPLYQHVEERLDTYFRSNTRSEAKGATVMNVCTAMTKTPFVRLPQCLIAQCAQRVPETYKTISWDNHKPWVDGNWALLLPRHYLDDIFSLLEQKDLVPILDLQDRKPFSTARLHLSKSLDLKVLADLRWEEPDGFLADWETGGDFASIKKHMDLDCHKLAYVTLVVSIHLRPYTQDRGSHTSKRHVAIWVHNMEV